MERRDFSRASPRMHVRLDVAGQPPIAGEVENVSIQGLLVSCDADLAPGTACGLTIALSGPDEGAAIRGQAIVVRATPDGLALEITRVEGADSARHLKNLVMYNADDPARVEREIDRWLRPRQTNGAR